MSEKTNSAILSSLNLLALTTSYLFALGLAQHNGVMKALELDTIKMELNFHTLVYQGTLSIIGQAWALAIAFLAAYIVLQLMVFRSIRIYMSENDRSSRLSKYFWGPVGLSKTDKRVIEVIKTWTTFVTIVFVLLITLIRTESEGEERGNRIKQLINDKKSEVTKIKLKEGDNDITLYFLACGSTNCAGVSTATGEIRYFTNTQSYSFTPKSSYLKSIK